ncbi:MAG: FG-GAP-like repeat-containing protein [Candidatus Zixiibacteriota bacterium]
MRRKDIRLAFLMALVVGLSMLAISSCDNPGDPVDNENPTIAITNPVDASFVPNTVDVRAEATDNDGVNKVEFYVDGELYYTDEYSPWACLWTTTVDDNGEHTIYARAFDEANNSATSQTVTVTCENYPPAAVEDLAATEPTPTGDLTLAWTAPGEDGNTGTATLYDIRYYWASITADNWVSAAQMTGEPEPSAAGTVESFDIVDLHRSSTYYFALKTCDASGNWSEISNCVSVTTPDMFDAAVTFDVESNANYMIVADLNDDDYLDLVVTHMRDTNNLSILYGNGDGTFQDPVILYTRRGPSSVCAADFNNDDRVDLVTTKYIPDYKVGTLNYSKVNRLLQQDGNVFELDNLMEIDTGFYWCTALEQPFWEYCQYFRCIRWDTTTLQPDHNPWGCPDYDIEVIDTTISFFYANDSSYASCPIDVDNDGDMDLAVANEGDASFSLLLNDGSGFFANPVRYGGMAKPLYICSADLNGDGYDDIVTNSRTQSRILVFRNLQNGTFAEAVTYVISTAPMWISIADVDGDADLDIVSACYGGNAVSILKNNGSGAFGVNWAYNTSRGPSAVAAVDLTGNGAIDLAVASMDEDVVAVLLNEDPFPYYSFNTVTFPVGDGPGAIGAGDFDGDGDNDIAVLNELDATISILFNRTIE